MGKEKKIIIPQETLYQKYIVENLTRYECAKFFNVSEKVVIRRLNEYGIKKDMNKIQDNREATMKQRYGVFHPSQKLEFVQKARQTMVKRYGVEYAAQSPILQEKMQDTMIHKYHKKNYVETDEFQYKSKKTCLEKYGVEHPCQYPQCIKALEESVGHSKPEKAFADLLNQYNFAYMQEYPLRGFKYDFMINGILFEIDPSATHNSNFGLFGKEPKPKTYHFAKYSVAKEFNLHCVHIFDWDNPEIIIKTFLIPKERVFARKCEIKEVPLKKAKKFLIENHIQGYAKDSVRLGLYYNNELVEIMTFAKPRYNKKYDYELVRLCESKNVIGGAEKLLKYFMKRYCPKNIISYCDLAKFSGEIYQKLGFKIINKPIPTRHWFNINTKQHITDNLLRQGGFDQIFKTDYGKGTSNEELMRNHGFVEVYDCGQLSFEMNVQNV